MFEADHNVHLVRVNLITEYSSTAGARQRPVTGCQNRKTETWHGQGRSRAGYIITDLYSLAGGLRELADLIALACAVSRYNCRAPRSWDQSKERTRMREGKRQVKSCLRVCTEEEWEVSTISALRFLKHNQKQ
ncbi:hypothetical protein J6590_059259 [Homalodisca vitripennis]|nr:hypothetical protein J6590_059259 [Homalodisca vitripennis]